MAVLRIDLEKNLGDFSLQITQALNIHTVLGVLGNNGAGKTTLLRLLAGLDPIERGVIEFGNSTWLDSNRGIFVPPHKRRIGMVFQNYALYPHMTVYKNMAFGLKLRRFPKEEIDRRVREAADIKQLKALMGDKVGRVKIIAKIEDQEGVRNLEEIIKESDWKSYMSSNQWIKEEASVDVTAFKKKILQFCYSAKSLSYCPQTDNSAKSLAPAFLPNHWHVPQHAGY